MKKYFCEFIENDSISFGAEGYVASEVDQRIAELEKALDAKVPDEVIEIVSGWCIGHRDQKVEDWLDQQGGK